MALMASASHPAREAGGRRGEGGPTSCPSGIEKSWDMAVRVAGFIECRTAGGKVERAASVPAGGFAPSGRRGRFGSRACRTFPLRPPRPLLRSPLASKRDAGLVQAARLVEATRVDGIAEVMLELRGLDPAGRVVSRGLGRTYGGRLLRWNYWPFAVSLLRTRVALELAVWSYAWRGTRDRAGTQSGGS